LDIVGKRYGMVAAAAGARLEAGACEFILPTWQSHFGAATMLRGGRSNNSAGSRK